jgi:hypothetical protein
LTAALKTASQQIDQAADEMKKLGFSADQVAVAQKAMSAEALKGAMAFRQQNDVSAMAARSFAILRGETEQTEKSATRARAAFLPLAAAVQQSIGLFKDMSPAMAAVTGAVDNMVFSVLGAAAATGSWSAALRVLMGIFNPWTIAIIAAGAALAYFVGKQKEAQKQTEDFRREWDRLNNATMQAETTTRQGAIQLDHLQEMAKIFSMKITEAQRNELIFKEQLRFGAEMTKLQREEMEKAAKEAEKYAETVAAARDSLVGQIEAVRIQTKELEQGKDAAIDYEMSILLVSDKVKLLGKEGEKLVGILKEEKHALEDLKSTQKLYDEAGKQAIKQFEDATKQSENFVKGLEDIQETLQLQSGAQSIKQIIGPLDQLEQKLIDLFGAIENLDIEGAATFKRLFDQIQNIKSIKVGAVIGEEVAKLKQQAQGFTIQAMPEGISKQIAEVNVQFENQRLALEKLIVDYRAFPEVVAAAQEALIALNLANTKVLQNMTPMMQIFDTMAGTIQQAIDTTLNGVLQGTQTLSEAMKNMARNIMMAFVSELNKQFIIAPLMQGLKNLLGGGLGGLFGGGASADIGNIGAGLEAGGFSIAGLQSFAGGGVVGGMRGQAVPIIAHAGERVVPLGQREGAGNQGNVQVKIMGDIVPREPTMRKEDVIQIGLAQFEDRGIWQQSLEQRMSPRR